MLVKIDVWAKKFQALQFYLLEETAASRDETIEMEGKVRIGWDGTHGEQDQSLEPQPHGVAPDDRFVPDGWPAKDRTPAKKPIRAHRRH